MTALWAEARAVFAAEYLRGQRQHEILANRLPQIEQVIVINWKSKFVVRRRQWSARVDIYRRVILLA